MRRQEIEKQIELLKEIYHESTNIYVIQCISNRVDCLQIELDLIGMKEANEYIDRIIKDAK